MEEWREEVEGRRKSAYSNGSLILFLSLPVSSQSGVYKLENIAKDNLKINPHLDGKTKNPKNY